MERSGVTLRRVPPLAVIVLLLLLLLPVPGVTPHKGRLGRRGRSPPAEDNAVMPAGPGEGQELLEETFIVSSVGEDLQTVNMARPEEEEAGEKGEEEEEEGGAVVAEAAALRDHLFDLAFCFNLASILIFL
ncbi:sperm-egg fusion protein LLCFC1 [Ornithorhynchus anatinus]|uniref:sperm-egg fusion protein LLCFC1 n=1 Tax=Ornithorhynchus anatinus TaxID=9258 RepID=UPI0010A75A8E|nr:sperm-egg fusion protein LLCFC1 [Ornithorhynchus anatinus]